MSKSNARHISTNIPSARTTVKSVLSASTLTVPAPTQSRSTVNADFIDYNAFDASRREIIRQEEEKRRAWTARFDPWLIDEYRQMYDDIAKNRGIIRENCLISLKRPEWQQAADAFPPLNKRLTGQRRRRILGSFPQTENDKIGWRLLPQQSIEIYCGNKIKPLPSQYKFSHWPIESFY